MNKAGFPIGIFTVNRWVTDETFYKARDVEKMLDHFEIDHTYPNWAVNKWLTAMMILFRPQIVQLIFERDDKIEKWVKKHKTKDVFEDRKLEIISSTKINVEKQLRAVFKASDAL
jgi:hypothetical protein